VEREWLNQKDLKLNNPDTPDEVITGNTELELNVTEAIELIDRLQKAIDQLE